jgi:TolB-like protein
MGRHPSLSLCSMLCVLLCASLAHAQDDEEQRAQADTPAAASAGGQVPSADGTSAPVDGTAPVEPVEKKSVLVPGFKSVGEVSAGELDTITGLVVYQVGKVKGLEVITSSDIQEMLAVEAEKAAIGCSDESSCMNEIADALGADLILAGRVGKLGPRYLIQLSLIDTAKAKPIARAQLQVRSVTQVGAEVVEAVHQLTLAFGGIPNIAEQKRDAAAAESRTSYAGRFVEFATEPDTVMLFAMLAGGLFALVAPIFWVAPIVQAALLWWLGDDIAGREYPRWWLAIPAGWGVYLAAFIVAAVAAGVGGVSTQLFGPIGLAGGGGIAISGAGAAVLMVFMLEPVVAWWAGTWGARDVALFSEVDEGPGEDEGGGAGEDGPTDVTTVDDERDADTALRPWATPRVVRVHRAIGLAAAWARSGAR